MSRKTEVVDKIIMRFLVLSTFCGSFPPHAPGIGLNKMGGDIC
jgi:hypothetical protein